MAKHFVASTFSRALIYDKTWLSIDCFTVNEYYWIETWTISSSHTRFARNNWNLVDFFELDQIVISLFSARNWVTLVSITPVPHFLHRLIPVSRSSSSPRLIKATIRSPPLPGLILQNRQLFSPTSIKDSVAYDKTLHWGRYWCTCSQSRREILAWGWFLQNLHFFNHALLYTRKGIKVINLIKSMQCWT